MKKNKLILAMKVLAIILICLISFAGIYVQKLNKMENIVKDFTLSKDLKGYREILINLSDANKVIDAEGKDVGDTNTYDDSSIESNGYTKSEEKVNSADSLTTENYQKSKKVMENRLSLIGVNDYNISVDNEIGSIFLQIPEDSNTDKIVSNITEIGSIELKDSEDNTEYLNNNHFKSAKAGYVSQDTGTSVVLELNFNKEGKKLLKDLSENEYKTIEDKTEETSSENLNEEEQAENEIESDTEEESESEEPKQKQLALYISGSQITTMDFETPLTDGKIQLSVGSASTDADDLADSYNRAKTIASVLNGGVLPLKYEVEENYYVSTDIKKETIKNTLIVVSMIVAILLVLMIIKNKIRGVLAAISYVGFIAVFILALRYCNVTIALSGIVASILVALINYLFTSYLLKIKEEDSKKYNKKYLEILLKLVPIFVISIIFCFMKPVVLMSFGMTMFWGILLMSIYNIVVTKNMIKQ